MAIEYITHDADGVAFDAYSFLDFIRRSNAHWWKDSQSNEICPWIFRGHANADWKLIPAAARKNESNKLNPLIEKLKKWEWEEENHGRPGNWMDARLKEGGWEQAAIVTCALHEAVRQFHELAFSLGMSELHFHNQLNGRLRASLAFHDLNINALLTSYSCLPQHHGIPTFLLDWTRQPTIAAHFATSDPTTLPGTKDISIVAFRLDSTKIFRQPNKPTYLTLVRDTPLKNKFLHAQEGLFTLQSGHDIYDRGQDFPSLEDIVSTHVSDHVVLKIIRLGASEVVELRHLLNREGLTQAHLRPTFDHVASTVISSWMLP